MPTFDPCPTSLAAGRIASFKAADRLSGNWSDLTGTYSLTNNNSIQIRRASAGRTIAGSATLCDWTAQQCWEATHSDLLRNGSSFTKCVVVDHTFADFTAQPGLLVGIYNDESGAQMEVSVLRAVNATLAWIGRDPSGGTNIDSMGSAPPTPVMFAYRYDDSTPQIDILFFELATSALLNTRTYSVSLGNRTREYYGRRGTASNATYNGTQTVIDCIQIFDSVLSNAQLQSICSHIWSQRELVGAYLRGMSA